MQLGSVAATLPAKNHRSDQGTPMETPEEFLKRATNSMKY